MSWIKAVVDYAAPLAFIAVFFVTRDMMLATKVLVAGCVLAIALGLIVERRLAPLPLVSGVLAIFFGGLTLLFQDSSFVKMKMTIVELLLAAVMFVGVALKKNPLKAMMGSTITLPDSAWRTLALRYGAFFVFVAVVNEVVWRTQTDETWTTWKLISMGLIFAFGLSQTPYMMKHMEKPDEKPALDPPDGGF